MHRSDLIISYLSKTQFSLEILNYISSYGISSLERDFAIDISEHPRYPNLVHLKYDPVNSQMEETISQQASGLVIDKDTLKVVSKPYPIFLKYDPNLKQQYPTISLDYYQ